jgi:hypothetical protein
MSKKYWTTYLKDYWHDWTPANAIREISQNALDDKSSFEYDFSGGSLVFTSKGVELPASTILLGMTTKRNDDNTVGGKGEGWKASCVILLREGFNVTIHNGSKVWTPSFEFNEIFGQEVFVITETEGSGEDLTFIISGVSEDLKEEVIHDCLYLQKDLGTVYEGERGRVLVDRSGKLYVGGLYVCDITGHKYSFDFAPKYLPLNRDRKSVDTWNLASNVTALLEEVLPASECAVLVNDRSADAGGYYSSFTSDEVAEEVYNLVKKSFGNTVVVCEDYDEKEKLEKRGFKNVEIVYNSNQRKLVQKAPSYQEFLEELEKVVDAAEPEDTRTPLEILKEFQKYWGFSSREQEAAFDNILDLFDKRGVEFTD